MDTEKFKIAQREIIEAQKKACAAQTGLAMQDLDNLNVEEITPLTPEIISRQATQNIGTIGHVAHGKSTLVLAISGTNVSFCYYFYLRIFYNFRRLNTERKEFVTLPLNWAMLTPSCISVQRVLHLIASNLTSQIKRIRLSANTARVSSFSTDMFPLWTAQVTMS